MAQAVEQAARAEARYVRISAQKARLVVDLIRGQQAGKAITILRSTNKRIAPMVERFSVRQLQTPRTRTTTSRFRRPRSMRR